MLIFIRDITKNVSICLFNILIEKVFIGEIWPMRIASSRGMGIVPAILRNMTLLTSALVRDSGAVQSLYRRFTIIATYRLIS